MRILGISDASVGGGAALYEGGAITWAIDEERLNRQKLSTGFPALSIAEVLRLARLGPEDIDAVYAADRWNYYAPQSERWRGWLTHSPGPLKSTMYRASSALSPIVGPVGGAQVFYTLKKVLTRPRRTLVTRRLRDEFGFRCPIQFVDHHHCHVMAAYLTAGRPNATAITLDGGGDNLCSRVYRIRDGRIDSLSATDSFHSIGNYYAYVTYLCGFTAHKHEGKITGLAPRGEPKYLDVLRRMIVHRDGRWRNLGGRYYWSAARQLEQALPHGWTREDLACSIQQHLEAQASAFVEHWVRASGEPDLIVAGGVFANVRLNQVCRELESVRSIFIHPGMGDEGLAYGAACTGAFELDRAAALRLARTPLEHVFLGPDITPADTEQALRAAELIEPPCPDIDERIAELLAEGYVVARCAGRMEYGPRALGNRSILYRPDDPSVNDWLNERLRRTEFMPFAPITRVETIEDAYVNASDVTHPARFMTITRHCTPKMRRSCGGVVHVDGTARPQYVDSEITPALHRILKSFTRRTGLSSVINTSFNIHEEPIVCTAQDAVRAFLDGHLDYLALGDRLIRNPQLKRKPAELEQAAQGD